MNEFGVERKKLEEVIQKYRETAEELGLKIEALPKIYANNQALLSELTNSYTEKLKLINRTLGKPYFARIDFKQDETDEVEVCYIGKVGVSDEDNKIITVDWRAPIASMYYDSNVGRASYEAPGGKYFGELIIKRQYDIEDGILKNYQDVDTVSNDEILKPYLGANADNRLKNIISTIQSEQNEIIREKLSKNLIVQGVAGSGKTTVALHRIAYLVYANKNRIKPEQYLVIGPNKFFINYISGVLPDLDVSSVKELTYDEVTYELLEEKFELISSEENLLKSIYEPDKLLFEKFKVSMKYKEALDKFLNDFAQKIAPNDDLIVRGYNILPKAIIKEYYDSIDLEDSIDYSVFSKKIERACFLLEKYINDNYDKINTSIANQFYEKSQGKFDNELEKERKNKDFACKELANKCSQSLKKYFASGSPKILNLYLSFLENIDRYVQIDNNLEETISKNISNIKNKKVEFEDLPALLYLKYRISGPKDFINYRHAVIDEAQDYGEFNFYSLKKIMPNSTFSIFGDLAQSIYQYRSIDEWQPVMNSSFDNNCDLKYLLKSYRTTTEIMDSANKIIKYIGLKPSQPVIRHGVEVSYTNFNNNQIEVITDYINDYLKKGYTSIAVICKDDEEVLDIHRLLQKGKLETVSITNLDTEYKGGICIITSYLSKGLEFDGVIIADASSKKYNSSKNIDMKLLYVGMTRALHELRILYSSTLVEPLQYN